MFVGHSESSRSVPPLLCTRPPGDGRCHDMLGPVDDLVGVIQPCVNVQWMKIACHQVYIAHRDSGFAPGRSLSRSRGRA